MPKQLVLGLSFALCIVTAILVGSMVTGSMGNPITALGFSLGVVGFLCGIVKPEVGLAMLVVLSGYLDFFKRFLVMYSNVSMQDVAGVLSAAPFTLAGSFLGCYLACYVLRRRRPPPYLRLVIALVLVLIASGLGLQYIETRSVNQAITKAANDGAYLLMVPVIYVLYWDRPMADILRFWRNVVLFFLPIALYGMWQFTFGLNDFEYNYLISGLTIGINLLSDEQLRPFSTLNSPHSFSVMMWFCFILSFVLVYCLSQKTSLIGKLLPWVFATALVLSLVRTSMGFALMTLPMVFLMRSRALVAFSYAAGTLLFSIVVLNAQRIQDSMDLWYSKLPQGSAFADQMFRLGTFSDRLNGYREVITNPKTWTLFGSQGRDMSTSIKGIETSHDFLSQLIIDRGIVITGALLLFCGWLLVKAHTAIFRIQDETERRFGAALIALVLLFAGSNLSGYAFGIFPLNLYVWMMVGFICVLTIRAVRPLQAPKEIVEEFDDPLPSQPTLRPSGARI
ncbi:MAG TPA: hypothetical protein VIT91_18155 [Chthoniobacterales bacterium]